MVFLDTALDGVLFLPDAGEADYLSGNAITVAAPEKEICRRRDHKRGNTKNGGPNSCRMPI
jgi:hypothetical protein